jgi:hypothetical protein
VGPQNSYFLASRFNVGTAAGHRLWGVMNDPAGYIHQFAEAERRRSMAVQPFRCMPMKQGRHILGRILVWPAAFREVELDRTD